MLARLYVWYLALMRPGDLTTEKIERYPSQEREQLISQTSNLFTVRYQCVNDLYCSTGQWVKVNVILDFSCQMAGVFYKHILYFWKIFLT